MVDGPQETNMESTRINRIAATLDDLTTMLDEIIEQSRTTTARFERMRQSVEKATDEIDQLESENRRVHPAG
jgi:methyl-accepting chemotaxis protein